MATLIERIKNHVLQPESGDRIKKIVPNPASLEAINIAEHALGFQLPELLKSLYFEVGNGGLGPGQRGIFGLPSAAIGFGGHSVVEWYLCFRSGHSNPAWPQGLLPICDWGCSIMSSIDCTKPESPVIRHDPNWDFEEIGQRLNPHQLFGDRGTLFDASWVEMQSLEAWLEAWLQDKDLFRLAYPARPL